MGGLFVCSILPFLSWNYETKARPRDAMVGIRLLESSWSRNVPDSDVRSQFGRGPLHLAESTFLPSPVLYQEGHPEPERSGEPKFKLSLFFVSPDSQRPGKRSRR